MLMGAVLVDQAPVWARSSVEPIPIHMETLFLAYVRLVEQFRLLYAKASRARVLAMVVQVLSQHYSTQTAVEMYA